MPATTGAELIGDAFALLNVFLPGESVNNNDGQLARRTLNNMLSQFRQKRVMAPFVSRNRFDLVADQGGEDDPYTIGVGGDFNVAKPANQNAIEAANLILVGTDPEVRVTLGIYTTDAYNANQLPSMSNSQPTGLFYNPTYASDLGAVFLWPVPDIATNDLELFLWKSVANFDDLTTTYYVPEGWPEMLIYNLAFRLQGPFGKRLSEDDKQIAVSSLRTVKAANIQLSDLANDVTFLNARDTLFNIETGQ